VQAAAIAFAADNGKVWLVLRPPTGARPVRPGLVTVGTVLLGVPPVQVPTSTAAALRRTLQRSLAVAGSH
jgi:hypothetical protein